MALDPVLQSVIRDPAFQQICPTGPNEYAGSDGEMDESLLSDHHSQAFLIISYESPTDLSPQRRFENDDDEADFFSTYVPASSAIKFYDF
ncbi:unnamed protein product [Rhizophagus irregularis]|nr:unnamed protein product [Rhizophagus irregularis]